VVAALVRQLKPFA